MHLFCLLKTKLYITSFFLNFQGNCSKMKLFWYRTTRKDNVELNHIILYCWKYLPQLLLQKWLSRRFDEKKRSYSTLIGIFFQLTWGPFKNLGEDGLVLAKYTKILTMHVFLLLKLYKAITPWLSSFLIWDNFDLFDGSIGFEFTFELWLACVEINSGYE